MLADKRRGGGREGGRDRRRWEGSSREEKNRKEVSKLQVPPHCTHFSPSNKDTYKTLIGIANKELVYSRKKPDTEIALNFKMGFT